MSDMIRVFRDLVDCPLWQAVRMASLTPAEIVHQGGQIGSLAPGKLADIVLIDERVKVHATYVGGCPVT